MTIQNGEVVYALKCEMVTAEIGGKRKQVAGRVVLAKSDRKYGFIKVLDTYVKYAAGQVTNCNTRWSNIEPWMIEEGMPRSVVVNFVLMAVRGHTLVTYSSNSNLSALGIDKSTVRIYAAKYVELQQFFKRANGEPYGMGPLIDYFGYQREGRSVVINHHCVEDAYYTLRLYLDWYVAFSVFAPTSYILSKEEYKTKHHLM